MGLFRRQPNASQTEVVALREAVATLRTQVTETAGMRMTQTQSSNDVRESRSALLTGHYEHELSTLYDAYKACPWISAPIDTIAKRITSGGIEFEPTHKGADPANLARLQNLFLYCNLYEDIVEITQLAIIATLIFGAGQWEVGWAAGIPISLFYADPVTIQPVTDEFGNVTGYAQRLGGGKKIDLGADQIVRFALRGPRGETLSPIYKILNSAVLYTHMMSYAQKFFENGARPTLNLELPEKSDEVMASRHREWAQEHLAGVENAYGIQVTYGGAKLTNLGNNHSDLEFLNGLKYLREEFLAVLGVPPSAVAVSDNGNRLTDLSDSADKQFRYNTINPIRRLFEEKINFHIVQQGFGIRDWVVRLREADYRSDQLLVQTIVQQVQEGVLTRDEARKELGAIGRVPGSGGNIATVTLRNQLIPVSDIATIHSGQFVAAQQAAATTGMDPHAKPKQLAQASPANPTNPPPEPPPPPTPATKEALGDLAQWQRQALRAVRDGKPPRPFTSDALSEHLRTGLQAFLATCDTADQVREVFDQAFISVRETDATPTASDDDARALASAFEAIMDDVLAGRA